MFTQYMARLNEPLQPSVESIDACRSHHLRPLHALIGDSETSLRPPKSRDCKVSYPLRLPLLDLINEGPIRRNPSAYEISKVKSLDYSRKTYPYESR